MTYDDLEGMYLESAEEEYQDLLNRRRKRDEEVRRRRELRARQQRMKVRTTLIIIALVAIAFISFGVVELVKLVSSDNTADEKALVFENIEVEESKKDTVTEEAEPEEELPVEDEGGYVVRPDSLGYNLTSSTDDVVAHGTHIFSGYDISKSDTTSYIASENMQSTYAIIIDGADGSVIAQKDGFTRINPASMTKIMTVLVAAEHLTDEDLDKRVTIELDDTDYAYVHDLSAVNWDAGEGASVRDLFYGTILPSGADAAHALAKYIAGDEDTFVEMMNDKLVELGLSDTTHFTNCVGSYNADHYSTCADMAMILKAAIENDFVYDVLNAHKYTTTVTSEHPEGIQISNWFLRRIEDKDTNGEVIGAKTGYVKESGSCASSFMISNSGHPYFCTTADAHSSWRCIYDHVDIYTTYTK